MQMNLEIPTELIPFVSAARRELSQEQTDMANIYKRIADNRLIAVVDYEIASAYQELESAITQSDSIEDNSK